MNLALPALVFFYLALPGFLLVAAFRGQFIKPRAEPVLNLGSPTMSFVWAVVAAPLLHALWVPLTTLVTGTRADLHAVSFLLAGNFDDQNAVQRAADAVMGMPLHVIGYFLSLYTAAATVGYLLHETIRANRLDMRWKLLRFNNEWHYLLKDPEPPPPNSEQGTQLTVTVEQGGKAYLYTGLFETYSLTRDGNLEKLVLLQPVFRRELSEDPLDPVADRDPGESERWYEIEGDRFIIWARDITSLNIDFVYMIPLESGTMAGYSPPA